MDPFLRKGPRSLVAQAKKACKDNATGIIDVGDLPWNIVRDILMEITSGQQLHDIEKNSPWVREHTADIWKRLISKHFHLDAERKKYAPKADTSWGRVYFKYKREKEEAIKEAESKFASQMGQLLKEKESNVTTIHKKGTQRFLPRPTRPGAHWSQGRSGSGFNHTPDQSSLRFTAGSRTKTTSGASVMKKARREAREVSTRMHMYSSSTGHLRVPTGQIAKAPEAMVNEHRIKKQQSTVVRPPQPTTGFDKRMKEREERLLKIKKAAAPKGSTYISDSDSAVDDGEDGLFGAGDDGAEAAPPKAPSKRPGILSNATRPSVERRIVTSPSKSLPQSAAGPSTSRTASSPPNRPAARGMSPPLRPPVGSPGIVRPKRERPVDIFNQRKKPRRV